MLIPYDQLAPETLNNIIESFVLQEGTDYGEVEASFEQKVEDIKKQLRQGNIVLVYSELYETVNILPVAQFKDSGSST